jgi:hypothetical protein
MRFRELQVEAADGTAPGLLGEVAARLRQAGAGASEVTPKVVRALGPRATGPPDVTVPALPPGATAPDPARPWDAARP